MSHTVFVGFLLSVSSPYPHFYGFLGFSDYDPELPVPPVTKWMLLNARNVVQFEFLEILSTEKFSVGFFFECHNVFFFFPLDQNA